MVTFFLAFVRTGKEQKMPDAREIMDVYMGSDEVEQFDLWFSNRELRTQFDAVDHLSWKRWMLTSSRGKNTRSKGRQKFQGRMAKCHPWPARV
jgi:hypothetical protein